MSDLAYTLQIETAKVYRVRALARWPEWASATIRSWAGGGSIDVQSDYGSYSYTWTSIGNEPFLKFLCGLDYDYFMVKARGTSYREFDPEGTVKRIHELVIESRRQGFLKKEAARDLFDEARGYVDDPLISAEGLGNLFSPAMWNFLDGDFPAMSRDTSETRGFWERIWPMLTDAWQKELLRPPGPMAA